ncbi:phosphoglycerate mutase [Ancylomarina euxinus]|uniref:Phosphoglycerate mutase n=1 Tax=Ancylomarina euxinus TaxID=2283627 RepID=A0A425XZB6_9BACT|nr:histidine phosphatase family protein [Ancylomarina euxinus]MCZ4694831.1 histidine phosphatase family protein [Ancylomarina euxinus]MUP15905.1 phosphoglycerate mutase [Ancylomarina euxinus]RRG20541.1 phosphoglycerate mutase [Ancylomarina euxinus]
MKQLILSRHAKTEVIRYDISDFERNLTHRGINDSALVSSHLFNKGIQTDLIVSSTANRAIATARLFAHCFNIELDQIVQIDQLYHGFSTQEFLEMLQKNAGQYERVWVFGHNPDIASWASKLLNKAYLDVPTGTAIGIEFDVENWSDINARSGKLIHYTTPKMLKQ